MDMPMEIPVYLFTGFLESGKTSFIQSILKDPNFSEGERTLLFLCEDGEEQYDLALLAETNTKLIVVEEPADFNAQLLLDSHKKYHPERVIIEWNGMWKLTDIPPSTFPPSWIIYQTVTTVNSETFDMYFQNMGGYMYEQLSMTDMIVFNRATEKTTYDQVKNRKVRLINRRADIFLDYKDGRTEVYEEDLSANLDLSKPIVDISEADFGKWYFDAMEHPERYESHTFRFLSQVYKPKGMQKGCFAAGRFTMLCCAEDISYLAFVCKKKDCENLKDRDWYLVTAKLRKEFFPEYQGEGPVLYVKELTPAERPADDVVYVK